MREKDKNTMAYTGQQEGEKTQLSFPRSLPKHGAEGGRFGGQIHHRASRSAWTLGVGTSEHMHTCESMDRYKTESRGLERNWVQCDSHSNPPKDRDWGESVPAIHNKNHGDWGESVFAIHNQITWVRKEQGPVCQSVLVHLDSRDVEGGHSRDGRHKGKGALTEKSGRLGLSPEMEPLLLMLGSTCRKNKSNDNDDKKKKKTRV